MGKVPGFHDGGGLLLPLRHLRIHLSPSGDPPLRGKGVLGRVHDLLRFHIRLHTGGHRPILPQSEGWLNGCGKTLFYCSSGFLLYKNLYLINIYF